MNYTSGPEITEQYCGTRMLICALETDSFLGLRKARNWLPLEMIGSQGPKRTTARQSRMFRKQKFNYQQLIPRFTTLELDKWTNETTTQIFQVSHFFTALEKVFIFLMSAQISSYQSFPWSLSLSVNSLLPYPASVIFRAWITTKYIIYIFVY